MKIKDVNYTEREVFAFHAPMIEVDGDYKPQPSDDVVMNPVPRVHWVDKCPQNNDEADNNNNSSGLSDISSTALSGTPPLCKKAKVRFESSCANVYYFYLVLKLLIYFIKFVYPLQMIF